MRRREFITLLSSAVAWPLVSRAQSLRYALNSEKHIGSIDCGSNVLTLIETSTFNVGDQVIVEVGGEAGQGKFGTTGVGGVVPAATDGWSTFYYRSKDCPLALVAKVIGVSDGRRTLMLDKSASTAARNACVYFDNYPLLNAVLNEAHPTGWVVTLPAGDFAISDRLEHRSYGGWSIRGAGKGVTVLRSPKGVPGGGLQCFETNDTEVRDLTIIGNAGENGFGIKDHSDWIEYGMGVTFTRSSDCIVRNVSCIDVFRKAAWGEYTNNLQVYDCDLIINEPFRGYLEWWFGVSDSANGTFNNCKIKSSYLISGFEGFRSNGVKFIECHSVNASFSMNSTGNFLIDRPEVIIKAGSQFNTAFHVQNPIFNINSNIKPPNKAMSSGGIFRNVSLLCEGYINVNNDLLRGIVINADNPNVTIDGGMIAYPDYAPPSQMPGPCGINSTGPNTRVRNLTVTGTVNPDNYPGANISVVNGTVANCTAGRIKVAGIVRPGSSGVKSGGE
jgi:hypothetical protein